MKHERKEYRSISVFRGVPFAKPPVGDRRWKPAEPLDKEDSNARSLASPMQRVLDDPNAFFYAPLADVSED